MPMPHRVQMQVIKRRLVGKEGSERIRELRAILDELPDYRSGPYGRVRYLKLGCRSRESAIWVPRRFTIWVDARPRWQIWRRAEGGMS